MESSAFDKFITGGLINSGYVSGAVLFSRQGQVMYRHGELKKISQSEVSQFLELFGAVSHDQQEQNSNTDFVLNTVTGSKAIYKSYQKTYSSVYATSSKGSGGLTVCNLPYGILVCVYNANTRAADAIKAVEKFCDLMRR